MHLLDYDQYKESGVEITGLRMFDLTGPGWPNWTEPISSMQETPTVYMQLITPD